MPFLDVLDEAFDFTAPDVLAAQDAGWFADSPLGPLVLRHAEAQELLRDRRLDHGGDGYLQRNGITAGPIHDWWVPMIVNRDGADHRRLRGLVGRSFTPRTVDLLRPFIRATAGTLADAIDDSGETEFVGAFADRLPLAVMSELLGVPASDHEVFSVWSSDIGLIFALAADGTTAARVERAVAELDGYIDTLIDEKARRPADDLISRMVAAWHDDETVTRAELRNLLVTLVFGAHDNTRHQISNALVSFAEHPAQWTLLREHPDLAARAVGEVMRWRPSAASVFRRAVEDFTFQDLPIAAGTFVTVAVQTAQRDPRAFPGGRSFDITAAREAPLLQFGAGPHYCLGSALAHAQLEEALPILAGRFGQPEITGEVTWRPAIGTHGPDVLPLRLPVWRQEAPGGATVVHRRPTLT
ncbi:cytochrome P450 [Actinoplanes xinjiangensis]|uniref:cytochrome P450 n=1 Tax=Actinoplanes xinjiangensis TaxID=512350 RepID=UPI0034193AE3